MKNFHPGRFLLTISVLTLFLIFFQENISAKPKLFGDTEFTGSFDPALMADTDDMDDVVFKASNSSRVKFSVPQSANAKITAARIYNPVIDKTILISALVENDGENPFLFVDLDMDGILAENEKFSMHQQEKDNPYIWETVIQISLKNKRFQSYPIDLMFFKDVKYGDEMTDEDRLVLQSSKAFACGKVDIKGKQTQVMYDFGAQTQKVIPTNGWLGVDSDGDGEIFIDGLSPEAAKADDETIVFRAGQTFVSTKKVDLDKNVIVLREHSASDYKRVDLRIGDILPDFNFTDFEGRKRKLSEFQGKYLLLDFWGMWCPPCRRELPYLKLAYSKFQARNFEIVGMNTDTDFTPQSVNTSLEKE